MKNKNDDGNAFYNFFADFGFGIIEGFKSVFKFLIISPLLFIFKLIKLLFLSVFGLFKKMNDEVKTERTAFNNDFKAARAKYKSNKKADIGERENPSTLLYNFIQTAFKEHKPFVKHVFNIILPVCAVLVLLIVINYNNRLSFALKVTYNDADIGYIESEKVFRDAEDIIKDRLNYGGQEYSSDIVSQPKYEISIIHPNELTDSSEICEKIIENSQSGLVTACGVYVDGKFICSVKNESDASYVFKKIISDYCSKNKISQQDSQFMVNIIEEVTYIQGIYSESTVMSSEQIEEYISEHEKSESTSYTSKAGDTVESVTNKYKLSSEQFSALNPDIDKEGNIKEGTKLNVIRKIPFINISVSETKIETKDIKFKKEEVKTDSLYQGTSKTVTEGKNGKKQITNLITYINGEKVSEKEISSVVTLKPVNEKIYVGTKPVPSFVELYGVKEGMFIWPAVGVDYVTSEFGYRILYDEPNFHRGLDISGANALGKPIIASAAGTVELVTAGDTGYGYSVLIDHGNGIKTRYGHCLADSIIVNVGDHVEQGQMIAQVGSTGNSTGPHLHFEIVYNGAYTNPLDYLTR